jgi:hypothetical protein
MFSHVLMLLLFMWFQFRRCFDWFVYTDFCFCVHTSNKLYDCCCFSDFNFVSVLWIWYTELICFVYADFILNLT